jgi:hypothetical protein
MPAKLKSDTHLAIAHVLFIDVVGYSKLLINEQREVVDELTRIVPKTPQFRRSEAASRVEIIVVQSLRLPALTQGRRCACPTIGN